MRTNNFSACLPIDAPKWQLAVGQLLQAAYYARDSKSPASQFAVEVQMLQTAGLTPNDLRWLNIKGFVDHVIEIGRTGLIFGRRFQPARRRPLSTRSCVVLTSAGEEFAQQLLGRLTLRSGGTHDLERRRTKAFTTPRWDAMARMLWFGPTLIKRFTVPALNQELVLAAFERRNWPSCIDDPLLPADGIDAKRRLHDTIIRLNRSHKRLLIRFTGNGNGFGVCWSRHGRKQRASTASAPDRV